MRLFPSFVLTATVVVAAANTAWAAPLVIQDVRVSPEAASGHEFVAGRTASRAVSASASASQLYWYDAASNGSVGALGGAASVGVQNVGRIRASEPHATAVHGAIARMTLGDETLDRSAWRVDLGSQLLTSNVANHSVVDSTIRVVDFGNAMNSAMWFDFTVGLWNGVEHVLATAMDQLLFELTPAPDSAGVVQHLGGDRFRFLETGRGGSGTSLAIRSALDGYHVRSLQTQDIDYAGDGYVNDWVDLTAGRTLRAEPVAEVPEPSALALMAVGLVGLAWRRRRAAA